MMMMMMMMMIINVNMGESSGDALPLTLSPCCAKQAEMGDALSVWCTITGIGAAPTESISAVRQRGPTAGESTPTCVRTHWTTGIVVHTGQPGEWLID